MLCSLRRPAAGVSVHLLHHRLLLPHRQGEPLCLPRTPACCHVLTPHQAALSGISAVGDGSGDDPPRQGRATPRRGRARHVDASRYERLPCAQRAQRLDARHGMPNRRHAQPSTCPTAPASLTRAVLRWQGSPATIALADTALAGSTLVGVTPRRQHPARDRAGSIVASAPAARAQGPARGSRAADAPVRGAAFVRASVRAPVSVRPSPASVRLSTFSPASAYL